ncbi:MAG: hypothetical protein DWG76_06250 [Chloroflexi bacterium]|nr:hypothetical protein [Chloroflexota bacterium]
MNRSRFILWVCIVFILVACGASPTAEKPTDTAAPEATLAATNTAEPSPEPTETEEPAEAIAIGSEVAEDGCTEVELNPAAWQPLYTAYTGGGDPFFHIHSQEAAGTFFFNMELYTVYGSSWTGQLGTFTPDCNANGLCVYLVPDAVNPYWVTEGDMEIVALQQVDGKFTPPTEINFSGLTLDPVPGSSSTGCYHIESLSIRIGADEN